MMITRRKNDRYYKEISVSALFLIVLVTGIAATPAAAEVNVNIGIFAPPPPVAMPGPPAMAVIPATEYVYYAPDLSVGLFFCNGYWFRPHEGHWFRSHSYRGPWRYIDNHHTPTPILRLPADYRKVPPGHYKVTHKEMKEHWKRWEKERHGDHVSNGRHAGPYRAGHGHHGDDN